MDTLGDKIYKLRKQLGFSQEELGFRIGVTRQTISKWEMNTMQPSAENIIALYSIFNVSADTFLINKNKSSEIEVNEIAATENSAKTNKKIYLVLAIILSVVIVALSILAICMSFVAFTPNIGVSTTRTSSFDTILVYSLFGLLFIMLIVDIILYVKYFKSKKVNKS